MARRTSKSLTRSLPPDEASCGPAGHQGTRDSRVSLAALRERRHGWRVVWNVRFVCHRQALPGLARRHGALSHSSIMAPRCGSVTSVCVPSLMRTLAVCRPRGRRDPRRHVASARRRHARPRARGKPAHDTQDRHALRARTP